MQISLRDLAVLLSNPMAVVVASVPLVRNYQSVLTRLSYIALLFYWYVYTSKDHFLFNEILFELFPSKIFRNGERSLSGSHWTLSIAEMILAAVFSRGFDFLFPSYYRTHYALIFLLNLVFLGDQLSQLAQLWLQKQITRLARLNRNVWRWRDLVIESACLSIMHRLDGPTTRAIMKAWWWMCHQFFIQMTADAIDGLTLSWLTMNLITWSNPNTKYVIYSINCLMMYRFWFRELGKFTNPNPPEHKYTSLKHPEDIRILLLYPRFGFGPICCSLVQGPHMRLLMYEAISYNWGSMDTTEEILVDGGRKKVTRSVYEILASYSSLFLPQLIWIDAICIDQENDAEKSQQVPLMKKIYGNALFTTMFLGRSPLAEEQGPEHGSQLPFRYDGIHSMDKKTQTHFEDTRLAFDLLNEFSILENVLRDSGMDIYKKYESLLLSPSNQRQWAALQKILRHPLFERVWVVQEVALSANVRVRYGDEVIDWEVLASGMEFLQDSRNFLLWLEWTHGVHLRHVQHTSIYNIIRMQRFRERCRPRGDWDGYRDWGSGWDTSLPRLLAESFYFKATNPRDLIYGLMSLCRDPVRVCYTISVEDVFLDAAKELIRRGAIQLLFHAAGLGNRLETNSIAWKLPSWVPDWTDAPKYKGFQDPGEVWAQKKLQGEGEVNSTINLKDDRTVAFSGTCIDVIDELGPVLFNTTHQAGEETLEEMYQLAINYEACWKLLQDSPHTADPYPHSTPDQSLHEAFRRTMFASGASFGQIQSPDEFLELFPEWEEKLKFFRHKPDAKLPVNRDAIYKLLQSMNQVTEQVKAYCGRRRLFISRNGYIGLCPPYARAGDLIYLVPGIHVPIVLRHDSTSIALEGFCAPPPQSSVKRYKLLVGECYAHGLMNGKRATRVGTVEEIEIN